MIAQTLKQLWYRQIDTDGTYTLGSKFYPAGETDAKIEELEAYLKQLRESLHLEVDAYRAKVRALAAKLENDWDSDWPMPPCVLEFLHDLAAL